MSYVLKTQENEADVNDFIDHIEDDQKRNDSRLLVTLMSEVTRDSPKMWGKSIIGFGKTSYSNTQAKDVKWFSVGFSPRKQNLTIYCMSGFPELQSLLGQLGKHSTGKSCLYIEKLEDIDMNVLREIVAQSVKLANSGQVDYS